MTESSPKSQTNQNLYDALIFLVDQENEHNEVDNPFEIILSPKPFTKQGLINFSVFQYELLLRKRKDGRWIFSTGTEGGVFPKYENLNEETLKETGDFFNKEVKNSDVTLHTHPAEDKNDGKWKCCPSEIDVKSAEEMNNEINLVVTRYGIVFYSCEKKFSEEDEKFIKNIYETKPRDELFVILKDAGIVKARIDFEDERIEDVVDFLNGNKSWEEIKGIMGEFRPRISN